VLNLRNQYISIKVINMLIKTGIKWLGDLISVLYSKERKWHIAGT
jgi:hypothetical protein